MTTSRRRFVLGLAMGLGAGGVALSKTRTVTETIVKDGGGVDETITWETESDWDNAVTEDGVAHESIANTDHSDASLIRQGYRYATTDPDLSFYYPMHENSGTTANALVGPDGTYDGVTLGTDGPVGTTAPAFDGDFGYVNVPDNSYGFTDKITASVWVNIDNISQNRGHRTIWGESANICNLQVQEKGEARFEVNVGGSWYKSKVANQVIQENQWHLLTGTYDGTAGEHKLFVDGAEVSSDSLSGDLSNSSARFNIGARDDGTTDTTDGQLWDARVYNAAKSQSHIQSLYDDIGTTGSLLTPTKSFSEPVKPDLTNMDYTLDGISDMQIDVIGSPNTQSEESVTLQLLGDNNKGIFWSNAHEDFRIKVYPHHEGGFVNGPYINSISLSS